MLRLNRSPTPPPPPPRGIGALTREIIAASIGVMLGAIVSGVSYLFREEPARVNETRGRTEFNRLRAERNETDIRELRAELRHFLEVLRTHKH
jgi:hypothetical protein